MRLTTLYHIFAVLIIFKINGIYTSGKMYTTATNKQYYINPDQKYTWFDSLSECLKMNMNLVSIETQHKSEEINSLVKSIFNKNIILWVGGILTHYPDSRNYIWISTGQKFNYTFWKYQNPDFSLNNEYCIQIGSATNMEWNDNVCEVKYGFICEYREQKQLVESQQKKLEMERNLQKCQQELQEHNILKENFKELKDLQQELLKLKKELQEVSNENKLRGKNLSAEMTILQELQKLQIELAHQLQKETRNLYEVFQNQQEWQTLMAKKLQPLEPEDDQEHKGKHEKYRQLSFQFNLLPNAQLPGNGNH